MQYHWSFEAGSWPLYGVFFVIMFRLLSYITQCHVCLVVRRTLLLNNTICAKRRIKLAVGDSDAEHPREA